MWPVVPIVASAGGSSQRRKRENTGASLAASVSLNKLMLSHIFKTRLVYTLKFVYPGNSAVCPLGTGGSHGHP